jgi:putative ABC transport system permease protein
LEFRKNEFISILGPSGCGKTTLLNIVGGLDRYTSGDLIIEGRSTKDYKDRDWDTYRNYSVGFVFQTYNLIPHQTVLGNVELALTIGGIEKAERIERAKRALDKVGLNDQYLKRPNQLSGGQMQRVAIARALVNDPEIVLADEPTGALDTETSKQIMNLLREVAKERLVIMVTHNSELAAEYSTRTIKLLDGRLVSDSKPYDGTLEPVKPSKRQKTSAETAAAAAANKKRAKMSFVTAFRLSAQNLISKRRRSIMVSVAGSIGIIGVALVLAFSFGIQGYITNMQRDMLSGNPITIEKSTWDINSMMGGMNTKEKLAIIAKDGYANIDGSIQTLHERAESIQNLMIENTITPAYVQFLKDMPPEYLASLHLDFGLDVSHSIYTDYHDGYFDTVDPNNPYEDSTEYNVSLAALRSIVASLLNETSLHQYANLVGGIRQGFAQLPETRGDKKFNAEKYILSQYNIVNHSTIMTAGRIATEADEINIVLGHDKTINDLVLAQMGFYSQQEFLNVIYEVTNDTKNAFYDGKNVPTSPYISYEKLVNKEFYWFPNNEIFTAGGYSPNKPAIGGMQLKVVGILEPKPNISYGMLESGLYYTTALAEKIIETNSQSDIADYALGGGTVGAQISQVPAGKGTAAALFAQSQGANAIAILNVKNPEYDEDKSTSNPMLFDNGTPNPAYNPEKPTINTKYVDRVYVGMFYKIEYSFKSEHGYVIKNKENYGLVGTQSMMSSVMGLFSGMMSGSSSSSGNVEKTIGGASLTAQQLGAYDLPNLISIYPTDLGIKPSVLTYLDKWNSNKRIILSADVLLEGGTMGSVLTAEMREDITYSDMLSIVFKMISDVVNIITIGLIAFTSLALVVSCVMIGIITYVSVVERVKEIGVIRSLGGRKRDVSNLFIAETFIIGLTSGVFGVVVTYLLSWLVSTIVSALAGIGAIAFLPIGTALIMITLSVGLTLISGLLPSRAAARKDPAVALRTE